MDIADRLTQKFTHWSRIVLDGSIRQHATSIQRAMIKGADSPADTSVSHIFVLSTGRVGTQTVAALANLSPLLFAYHEPAPFLQGLSKQAYLHGKDEVATKILVEAVSSARTELWGYSQSNGRGYIETSPQVTFLAPIIMRLLPKAKFIHLVRDPIAVIRSGMKRKWYAGHISDATRIVPSSISRYSAPWQTYTPFQKNIWLWAETNRWIRNFCLTLPSNQTMTIQSEDLFSGEANTINTFYAFINSPLPPKKYCDKVLRKRLNRYSQGAFSESDYWAEERGSNLFGFAADVSMEFGYDLFDAPISATKQ